MHGVGAEALIDQTGADDFRRHAGVDVLVRKTTRGVLGEQQFSDFALRIGQRRRHRVPAIENCRAVGSRLAVAPGRPAAGVAARRPCFTGAALKTRFFIAVVHGALVSWVPDNGNLWPKILVGGQTLFRAPSG